MTPRAAPDVASVGGGIVGTAAAADLATAGLAVTLVERETIAAAASGRNSGVIQHPFDPLLVELYRSSVERYRALAGEPHWGFVMAQEPAGLLALGSDERRAIAVRDDWAAAYPETRPELVSGSALQALEPALAPDVVGCRIGIGFPVVPAAATHAFAAVATDRGATIQIGGEARLVVREGRVFGVEVDGSLVPAGAVIVAAGPWTPAVVDPTGSWRPIRSAWGVVADVRLGRPPRHVLEEIEIDFEPGDDATAATAAAVDFSLVTADGASSLGSTFLASEPDPAAFAAQLVASGSRYVPKIATAQIRGLRACARPLALDGRPLIGAVPGIDGLFVAAGNGPWGISTGPATAALVVDLVLGRPAGIPPELDVTRFGPIGPGSG